MLTIGKLAPGQQQYYLDTVARGAEEYYTGTKETPGRWYGASAARLGLNGEVDAEALHRLLNHRDPSSGERLTDGRSEPKVVGFDATFCAPKSVSLLFALGDPETSNDARNAHDIAVTEALRAYETVAHGRREHAGARVVDGEGFVAAAFRHRTSRAADPQLHTHVVIANLVHAPEDGRWSALDGRPIHTWARPIGHLYEAQLRWELTRRLGVDWTEVHNGIADVAGIPRSVLEVFSTRRAEIEQHLAERNEAGAKAAQRAAYATRKAKDRDLDVNGLVPQWRARAVGLGFGDTAMAGVLRRHDLIDPPAPDSIEADDLFRQLAGPDGLTLNRSTFTRRDVINGICDALPHGGRVDDVLVLVDGFLDSGHVIALNATPADVLHTRRGRLVPSGVVEAVYSTPDMIATEQRLLHEAARRRHGTAGIATPDRIEAAISDRPTLSDEQAAMVRNICSSGAGVEVVEGVAGAGKTFALAAAHDAWATSGHRVRGVCLAARAAKQLEDGSAIPSMTVDRMLRQLDNGGVLSERDVVVVDEAGMVGTRKLLRLLEHAGRAEAKVVLIGDPRQLPEIQAGGALAALVTRFGVDGLRDNRRQVESWERDALAALRAGEIDRALDTYAARGRLHHDNDGVDVRDLLVDDWWEARANGEQGVMIAIRLRDVDDLNERARQHLSGASELGLDELVIGGRAFAVGDHVLTLRNDYCIGVLNGTRAVVTAIDYEHQSLTVRVDIATSITLPSDYLEAGHLSHGYATTLHKAQGATVERAFILADDTYTREHLYTALSRGALRNDLYLVDEDPRVEDRHAPEVVAPTFDAFRAAARRSSAQQLAWDQATIDLFTPLETLRVERDELRVIVGFSPGDPRPQLQRISEQLTEARQERAEATHRVDEAQDAIDTLGPLGRRIHRRDVEENEHRIAAATLDVGRLDRRIEKLVAEGNHHTESIPAWDRWQEQFGYARDRLRTLDERIATIERERDVAREPGQQAGTDTGIDIGP